jgi:hypothetical protein
MRRWWFWLVAVLILIAVLPLQAQSGALVAFVNGSGQLVVSSGDGAYRWIVTNPGEFLVDPVGYNWSPGGDRVFFTIDLGGEVSLRVGDVTSQSAVEIGRVSNNNLSGGEWVSNGVLVGTADRISYFDASNGSVADVITGQGNVSLLSPFANDHPNLPQPRSVSPSGDYLFYQQGDGRYAVAALDGSSAFPLPGANDPNARLTGLWSDSAALVAYWGFEGNSVLSVTDAGSGATVTLDSGRATPITPLGWRANTNQLLYRDGAGIVRLADVSCLFGGCGANPLESGVEVLPASATDVQTNGDWAFYQDGDGIYALWLGCAESGACAGSAITLGGSAVPNTMIHMGGGVLAYTGYSADPNNPNDRDVRVVSLGCLNSGGCSPQSVLGGAVAGLVAPDGGSMVVEQLGVGLNVLNLSSLSTTYLSDGGALVTARWG